MLAHQEYIWEVRKEVDFYLKLALPAARMGAIMQTLNVFVSHSTAESLWFVESSDIPGLNIEAPSYEQLIEIVLDAAPDLIDYNVDETMDDHLFIPVSIQQIAYIKRVHHT